MVAMHFLDVLNNCFPTSLVLPVNRRIRYLRSYQFINVENRSANVGKFNCGGPNFPCIITRAYSTNGPSDDLVAETNAYAKK